MKKLKINKSCFKLKVLKIIKIVKTQILIKVFLKMNELKINKSCF